jgi:DNA-binding transcriptional regulator YdaS (Cro superfamily)
MGHTPPIPSSPHDAPKRDCPPVAAEAHMRIGAVDALRRACALLGGQKPLARRIGTTQSRVWYWLEKSRYGAAAQFALPIEAATGVPRHELRPDIYPAPAKPSSDLNSDVSAHNLEAGHGMDR